MHKIIYFFPEKNIYVCLPYLDPLPETHLFFNLAYAIKSLGFGDNSG